jgi:hypothetical protein
MTCILAGVLQVSLVSVTSSGNDSVIDIVVDVGLAERRMCFQLLIIAYHLLKHFVAKEPLFWTTSNLLQTTY